MSWVGPHVSRSLREYILLPHKVVCAPEEVSLAVSLGKMRLQYPFLTARMQSVVGPAMAIAAGRQGILTCIPRSLPDGDKQAIIDANNDARLKEGDIELSERPAYARPEETLGQAMKLAQETGFSVIPIINQKAEVEGFFTYNPDRLPFVSMNTQLRAVMTPLRSERNPKGVAFLTASEKELDKKKIKKAMEELGVKFLPILDSQNRLIRLAFKQRHDTNFIGIAISSRGEWKKEFERWAPQVDTLLLDSSNCWFPDAMKIVKYAKEAFPDKSFGVGNVVTKEAYLEFAQAGADYVVAGMAVGSICQTGSYRGNGRGQATVAVQLAEARDEFAKKGKYVPIVIDGGISNVKDMTIALALGDFIMMGNMFNRFHEAAGRPLDTKKHPVMDERTEIKFKETWGEGHPHARRVSIEGMGYGAGPAPADAKRSIERYGHLTMVGATVEGVKGMVPYAGRLKPGVEDWARYIRTTIANCGGKDLKTFRENVQRYELLELMSAQTVHDIHPHDVHDATTE